MILHGPTCTNAREGSVMLYDSHTNNISENSKLLKYLKMNYADVIKSTKFSACELLNIKSIIFTRANHNS